MNYNIFTNISGALWSSTLILASDRFSGRTRTRPTFPGGFSGSPTSTPRGWPISAGTRSVTRSFPEEECCRTNLDLFLIENEKTGWVKLIEKWSFKKCVKKYKSGNRSKKILSAIDRNNPWGPPEGSGVDKGPRRV